MTKDQMIDMILNAIETSDSVSGDYILIRKRDAIELVRMLAGKTEIKRPAATPEGKVLFYCADCAKSFWAAPREDPDCYTKYQYHTWYAACPFCGIEVSQNDRYWR